MAESGVSTVDDACVAVRLFDRPEIESAPVDCARDDGFVARAPLCLPLPEDVPPSLGIGTVVIAGMSSRSPIIANAVACVAAGIGGGAAAWAVAYSDSLSPIHALTNHRPPPMPRTSRFACRQCRTFLPLLSSGVTVAKPDPILGGGWTGKGLFGSGYEGSATPSKFMSSALGARSIAELCAGSGMSRKSGLGSSPPGDEGAVPAYAAQTNETPVTRGE